MKKRSGNTSVQIQCCLARLRKRFSGPYGGGTPSFEIHKYLNDLREVREYVKRLENETLEANKLIQEFIEAKREIKELARVRPQGYRVLAIFASIRDVLDKVGKNDE